VTESGGQRNASLTNRVNTLVCKSTAYWAAPGAAFVVVYINVLDARSRSRLVCSWFMDRCEPSQAVRHGGSCCQGLSLVFNTTCACVNKYFKFI
jgi:hypothetical protein